MDDRQRIAELEHQLSNMNHNWVNRGRRIAELEVALRDLIESGRRTERFLNDLAGNEKAPAETGAGPSVVR